MRLAFFSEEVAKLPRSSPGGGNRTCYNFQGASPNNFLVGSSKLPCERGLGFIYDPLFTHDETEDEKRQGHTAREAMEEVGADHGSPIITRLSSHQSTLYLAKLIFHKTALVVSLYEYIYMNIPINLTQLYIYASSFPIHLYNLSPMINLYYLLTFL